MNSKRAKRIRQLVRHLMSSNQIENKKWLVYGKQQKYVEVEIPDYEAEKLYDEDGKIIIVTKKQLVATGTVMMDPSCGRAIYKKMKEQKV